MVLKPVALGPPDAGSVCLNPVRSTSQFTTSIASSLFPPSFGKTGQRVWVGRCLEGVTADGKRINKSVVLGDEKQFTGKKMALRALEPYLKK
jgi:hypothetical protein